MREQLQRPTSNKETPSSVCSLTMPPSADRCINDSAASARACSLKPDYVHTYWIFGSLLRPSSRSCARACLLCLNDLIAFSSVISAGAVYYYV